MDKKIFEEAIEAFAQHARNISNDGFIEIANLLTSFIVDYDPVIEAKIAKHPKGCYAAEWIETHVYEPDRHSLASAFWLASMTLQDREEFGARADIEIARRKLASVMAEQVARGYR